MDVELQKLLSFSQFLNRWVQKYPESIDQVLHSPWIDKFKLESEFEHEIQSLKYENSEDLAESLRKYKYHELLRITLKDFKYGTNTEVLAELSYLANQTLKILSDVLYEELCQKYETPLNENQEPIQFCILAMGKMGGNELNYSSDIDLIAFISTLKSKSIHKSPVEFFSLLIKKLTQIMEDRTEHGFLYRVDWDLRPESKAGPLINSLGSLLNYYETFGADWERQAMIKAKPVAGNLDLGKEFINRIESFVYRKYFDMDSINRILSMKGKIHREIIKKSQDTYNVKLGIGGIREIEFFVQAFLLIYGGKQPQLRSRNTLETIDLLAKHKLMNLNDSESMKKDYLFLRSIEHRLQIIDEKQTHQLPHDPEKRQEVAESLNEKDFEKKLSETTLRVHQKFDNLFSSDQTNQSKPFRLPIELVPQLKAIKDELKHRLSSIDSFEQKLYELRHFKNQAIKKIKYLEKKPHIERKQQCIDLTLTAEAIIQEAHEMAQIELEPRFGKPYFKQDDSQKPSHLLILGMGKVGSYELNYGSDLDVIFIYSENGSTEGGTKSITNQEYFAKLVQKIISIMSTNTIGGKCYEIDTELRPSGHFGPLVTSFENFLDYQQKTAQLWEKQALLRARPIAGAYEFANMVIHQLDALLYQESFSPDIKIEMNRLRLRVEHELAKEEDGMIDLKLGSGGIMDIEFIAAYHQLTLGHENPDLQINNTFDLLKNMKDTKVLSNYDGIFLEQAYIFYRNLETQIYLAQDKSQHRICIHNPIFAKICPEDEILEVKKKCREIYLQFFKS